MKRDGDSDVKQAAGWAEHTVVANLPRRFPGVPVRVQVQAQQAQHAPLSEVQEPRTLIGMPQLQRRAHASELGTPLSEAPEPRTVVGEVPSRATAQQLLARYAALSAEPAAPLKDVPETLVVPLRKPWLQRALQFAREDFRRAPRIVRLLLPALPLIAAATTFLDVDPRAPSLSRAVAVAATGSAVAPAPSSAPPLAALPTSAVTILRHAGRTLAAEAADAAARGDRAQAIAIYVQLARQHPEDVVYASAARILIRDEERKRPHSGQ